MTSIIRHRDVHTVEIVPPEGVPLRFEVGMLGDRAMALIIDLLVLGAMVMCVSLFAFVTGGGAIVGGAVMLAFFLLRNGYFLLGELRNNGTTIGKRRLHLRVIDANGTPLLPGAILVRNLTREFELFMPLVVLANPETLVEGVSHVVRILAAAWVLGIGAIPWLNKERRRLGDLLAGTMVVADPRHQLAREIVEEPQAIARTRQALDEADFRPDQLTHYGVYELQVLEEVLRGHTSRESVATVADKIRTKIGWPAGDRTPDLEFLKAFYKAQRTRLESDLVVGKARERKAEVAKPKRKPR